MPSNNHCHMCGVGLPVAGCEHSYCPHRFDHIVKAGVQAMHRELDRAFMATFVPERTDERRNCPHPCTEAHP